VQGKEEKIVLLENEAANQSFWDDHVQAQKSMKELSGLKEEVGECHELDEQVKGIDELLSLAISEGDEEFLKTFADEISEVAGKLKSLEFRLSLSGEYDQRNAIVSVHAGAGGVESQDWVGMIMRMYLRWAERRRFATDVLDISLGEEAGVKSAVIQVSGEYAYGYLKGERGVHRLVRISPFDADHARHTSFALLQVLPEAEEGVDVKVDPDDIKIDVFRAGGAGGQSVQKNSTAVRITHLESGIVVRCQNERSQHQNKAIAMRILLARLVERAARLKNEEVDKLRGEHISPEWGNQIRSYVLHPYRMVKDHRTGFETSDAVAVLDGDIDGLVNSYLASVVGRH